MSTPDTWTLGEHTSDGVTKPTYRRDPEGGPGPGVVVVHEIPGLSKQVLAFGDELVAAGHTVVMPHLFGQVGQHATLGQALSVLPRLCISREFSALALGRTPPVARWLRSLCRTLHAELGGPGVGALGMCFTGGFALAMMVDDSVAAPVLAQPSSPMPIGRRRAADLNLSPADLAVVKERAAAGCEVLGVRYAKDAATGTRFDTLDRELGDSFRRIDLDGKGHSTLTMHRQDRAVEEVLAFFARQLGSPA